MRNKGQVALVSAVMIIILVILAIFLTGYLFTDSTVISVKGSDAGVFYIFQKQETASVSTGHSVAPVSDCCNTYTYINYHTQEVIPHHKVQPLESVYYTPTCHDCGVPKTFTAYYDHHKVELVPAPMDQTFYVKSCSSCNVNTYTAYHTKTKVVQKPSYAGVHYVSTCAY